MTNEQLAILLDGINTELGNAICEVRTALAADRPKRPAERHDAQDCFGFNCTNPEHFCTVMEDDPVDELTPLDTFWQNLVDRIAALRPT